MGLPFCTIDEAIGASASGDTIHIAPGVYFENLTVPRDLTFSGTQGLAETIVDGDRNDSVFFVDTGVSVTFEGLTIRKGEALGGGGIRIEGLTNVTVRDCLVTCNRCVNCDGSGGGGIGTAPSVGGAINITIENSTVSNNGTFSQVPGAGFEEGGGIRHSTIGDLVIRDSAILDNQSDLQGGAIATTDARMMITNTTISGNTAGLGAAIVAYFPPPGSYFEHVTIANNVAGRDGAGYCYGQGGSIVLRHCIVADNVATSPSYPGRDNLAGDFTSGGFNLIGNNLSSATSFSNGANNDLVGSPNSPIDPRLGPLGLNGGDTLSHSLLPGSPAIDAGDPLMFLGFDQRGVPRPFNGFPDIGAFEFGSLLGSFCIGNGGDSPGCTDCPCGNNAPPNSSGGCLNRTMQSAVLSASGNTSVSLASGVTSDLRFACSGLPPSAFSVLLSGDAVAPQNPSNPCFGLSSGTQSTSYDGLRCAVQAVKRHGGRAGDSAGDIGTTNSPWGGEGAPPAGIAQAMGGFASGQLRFFQAIYREEPLAGCMRGLNTTQAIGVVFTP